MKIKPSVYPYYEVHFLNLGDADSIIIAYQKDATSVLRIALIDAGNVDDFTKIKSVISRRWERDWIDIAVLTHPHKDHMGGFFGLLDDANFVIKEFWLSKPWVRHSSANIEMPTETESMHIYNHPTRKEHADLYMNLLVKQVSGETKIVDVCQGHSSDIMPLSVVGPTLEFGDLAAINMVSNFEEVEDDEEYDEYVDDAQMTDEDAVSVIDVEDEDSSCVNPCSLILIFEPKGKFLLTGDATRASLKAMIDEKPEKFKKCVLKVPHHGSKHNLNSDLINRLDPKQSAICANGSKKHPNNSVVYWLSKFGNVYLTKKGHFYYTSEPHNRPAKALKEKMQK